MKKEQIFIGNIKKCTAHNVSHSFKRTGIFGYIESKFAYQGDLEKENAVLLRLEDGCYVDIEKLNSILDYLKLCKDKIILNSELYSTGIYTKTSELIIGTSPISCEDLFVDKSSIVPYYDTNQKTSCVSIHQLKKQMAISKKRK